MTERRSAAPDEFNVARVYREHATRPPAGGPGATACNVAGVALIVSTAPIVLLIWVYAAWSTSCSSAALFSGSRAEVIVAGVLWTGIPVLCGVLAKFAGRPWGNWAFGAVLLGGASAYMGLTVGC